MISVILALIVGILIGVALTTFVILTIALYWVNGGK